ncbi:hypothetical protein ABTO24_19960, partial [Acinetobacter baumannii]
NKIITVGEDEYFAILENTMHVIECYLLKFKRKSSFVIFKMTHKNVAISLMTKSVDLLVHIRLVFCW